MKTHKSIVKRFKRYIVILLSTLILSIFIKNSFLDILLFFLMCLPICYFFYIVIKKFRLYYELLFILISSLIFFINFRIIRSYMLPPMIGQDGTVGFTHYFGYPFYFESIVFLIFFLAPFFVILIKKVKMMGNDNYEK